MLPISKPGWKNKTKQTSTYQVLEFHKTSTVRGIYTNVLVAVLDSKKLKQASKEYISSISQVLTMLTHMYIH